MVSDVTSVATVLFCSVTLETKCVCNCCEHRPPGAWDRTQPGYNERARHDEQSRRHGTNDLSDPTMRASSTVRMVPRRHGAPPKDEYSTPCEKPSDATEADP
jgi:hypothetical protein